MSDINQTTPILGAAAIARQARDRQPGKRDDKSGGDAPEDDGGRSLPRDIDVVISLMGIPVEDATEGVRHGLAAIMAEFDRQRVEMERAQLRAAYLEQQQDRDPVLPVAGRLALLRRLSRAIHRSEQSKMTNALLALHVAGVEAVRVASGRAAAERVMKAVAARLQAPLRQTDFLASLGGFDFGLLLPLSSAADAEEKARVLADDVAGRTFGVDGGAVRLDVRWGIAVFGESGDPDRLLDAADADMMARHAGADPLRR